MAREWSRVGERHVWERRKKESTYSHARRHGKKEEEGNNGGDREREKETRGSLNTSRTLARIKK